MIPDWLQTQDRYEPPRDGNAFALRTLRTLGGVMARLQVQRGRERFRVPAAGKLLVLLAMLLTLSLARNRLLILAIAGLTLGAACLLPARELWSVLRPALGAAGLALALFLPAMALRPVGIGNNLTVVGKVLLSVTMVNLFNRRTQWNHITRALRQLRIPGVFVFVLDLTLKYIVLLGGLIEELLTARSLRAVGRDRKKYASVGGVLGQTFLHASALSRETWEAMQCRGYTDDP